MRFSLKTIGLLGLLMILSVGRVVAEPVQLQQLLEQADLKNPSLRAAFERVAVADSQIDQVTSLADPILSVSLSNYPVDELASDKTPMTGNEIRLAQQFPFPGKLDARGRIAAQKSRWFAAAYEDARLQMRQMVKDAWYRLLFQRRAIELTRRNLTLFDDFIKLTETRYEVGRGLQQNVLQAHLQRSQQLDMLLELEQQEAATLAELNSLAGRETGAELQVEASLEGAAAQYELRELQRLAVEMRPMFASYAALIEQYKAERALAKLDYKPDLTLWGGYRWRDDDLPDGGPDFISAGASINLPRPGRRAAAVAEADSNLRLAYHRRDDFRNTVNLAIHRALTRYRQASKLVELYQSGILPQANQTFQSTLSAYQVDKVNFLTLIDSVMSLYRDEIDYARALSNQQRSQAELEAAAGLGSDELPAASHPPEGSPLL